MKVSVLFASSVGLASAFTFPSQSLFGWKSTSSLAAGAEASFVETSVADNKVMIFSKSYCPYCNKAKEAFDAMGVSYGTVELDRVEGGAAIQAALLEKTGQRTVPNVWVKGKHLGGCDDTLRAKGNGELAKMLE